MSNRIVDLVSYLPPFMQEYKEVNAALTAENPEFDLALKETEHVFNDTFIEFADECGISRFEKILGIVPSPEDTIESRRARVKAKWYIAAPYTVNALLSKLNSMCGDNFKVTKEFDMYKIIIETSFTLYGQIEELEDMLDAMLPSNITAEIYNRITKSPADSVHIGATASYSAEMVINTELYNNKQPTGAVNSLTATVTHNYISIDMKG